MLNDLLNEIDKLQGSIEYTRNFIKTLKSYRGLLVESINNAERLLLSLKNNNEFDTKSLEAILQEVKNSSKFILQNEILNAVRTSREFAFPRFVEALLGVTDEPNLITIRRIGNGMNISVDIEFLGIAGNLSDWAKGVVKTREDFKISRGPDAQMASKIWREKIYQNPQGPYDKTIRARIENSTRPAAFWLLLDKGTTSLASDRGGTAYPSYTTPTNFVDKAITKIKELFRNRSLEVRNLSKDNISIITEEIAKAKSYLLLIDTIINEISVEIEKNRALYSKFSKVITYTDQNKLDNVLARVRKNLDVGVTAEGRIELGVSGRRYRPYLSRLKAIVGE